MKVTRATAAKPSMPLPIPYALTASFLVSLSTGYYIIHVQGYSHLSMIFPAYSQLVLLHKLLLFIDGVNAYPKNVYFARFKDVLLY